MPTIQEPGLCVCGCGDRTFNLFAPGHDHRYRGHCLDRISAGDATAADDMEHYIPGHAKHYDLSLLAQQRWPSAQAAAVAACSRRR